MTFDALSIGALISAHGGRGNDRLAGGAGDDYLAADGGADVLNGGLGNDVMQGEARSDILVDPFGANLLAGMDGADDLADGPGASFFVGGRRNDGITRGGGADVIAFNRGDGRELVRGSASATLSLGGGISYQDLFLRISGTNLVVDMGERERIRLVQVAGEPQRRQPAARGRGGAALRPAVAERGFVAPDRELRAPDRELRFHAPRGGLRRSTRRVGNLPPASRQRPPRRISPPRMPRRSALTSPTTAGSRAASRGSRSRRCSRC